MIRNFELELNFLELTKMAWSFCSILIWNNLVDMINFSNVCKHKSSILRYNVNMLLLCCALEKVWFDVFLAEKLHHFFIYLFLYNFCQILDPNQIPFVDSNNVELKARSKYVSASWCYSSKGSSFQIKRCVVYISDIKMRNIMTNLCFFESSNLAR